MKTHYWLCHLNGLPWLIKTYFVGRVWTWYDNDWYFDCHVHLYIQCVCDFNLTIHIRYSLYLFECKQFLQRKFEKWDWPKYWSRCLTIHCMSIKLAYTLPIYISYYKFLGQDVYLDCISNNCVNAWFLYVVSILASNNSHLICFCMEALTWLMNITFCMQQCRFDNILVSLIGYIFREKVWNASAVFTKNFPGHYSPVGLVTDQAH